MQPLCSKSLFSPAHEGQVHASIGKILSARAKTIQLRRNGPRFENVPFRGIRAGCRGIHAPLSLDRVVERANRRDVPVVASLFGAHPDRPAAERDHWL
jgi:hypothetical protein